MRSPLHARQADEAYQVGRGLTPVGAYLAQEDIIRIALEHGVDMIHPGYLCCLYRPMVSVLNAFVATVFCPKTPSSRERSSRLASHSLDPLLKSLMVLGTRPKHVHWVYAPNTTTRTSEADATCFSYESRCTGRSRNARTCRVVRRWRGIHQRIWFPR